MTEQLKCPCGKRHGSPRGATSHISEALNPEVEPRPTPQDWRDQVNLYAQDFPFRPMAWQVTDDPPTIRAVDPAQWATVPEMMNMLHNPLPPPSDAVRDATDEHRRRVNARWAADRAMARARRRG